jgi:hypothetical protein
MKKQVILCCEKCGKISDEVSNHHVFNRNYRRLVDDEDNKVPLCYEHHVGSSEFSAHGTPYKFKKWIIEVRGKPWWDTLEQKAHQRK